MFSLIFTNFSARYGIKIVLCVFRVFSLEEDTSIVPSFHSRLAFFFQAINNFFFLFPPVYVHLYVCAPTCAKNEPLVLRELSGSQQNYQEGTEFPYSL